MKLPQRALVLAMVVATANTLSAQTMRSFNATRPAAGERMLRATLDFGAGRVVVQPGSSGSLYRAVLRYDAERAAPVQDYDARTGILHLGLEAVGGGGVRVTSRAQLDQTGRFEFSPDIPLSFTANLGAADATMDLGGTTLVDLAIWSGATRSSLTFSRPTKGECRKASFTVGASELDVRQLANAGCDEITVEGGVGRATLGFEGEWRRNSAVAVALSMGTLTLRVPRGVGLQITAGRFLTSLDVEGLIKRGNVWSTEGFSIAPRKLTIELKTSMAGVNVEWVGAR
ncbi:MAG: hypothetical protein V4558_15030 [Gemmatimonadota bacterium]